MSKIEWTETTWNPVTGCTKVSAGCKFCYALSMSKRLKAMGLEKYQNGKDGFELTTHEVELSKPYKWKKPRMIFVNSMSDLFHKDVPLEFIQKVFKVMRGNPHHTFQVLTKRAERLAALDSDLTWPSNVWMGVSVENQKVVHRIDYLRETGAKIKFLSLEPLLEGLPNLNLTKIDWVIVGGESGRNPRPMKKEWVLDLLNQCQSNEVPFFFKQWGGINKKKAGRLLEGKIYNEMPL